MNAAGSASSAVTRYQVTGTSAAAATRASKVDLPDPAGAETNVNAGACEPTNASSRRARRRPDGAGLRIFSDHNNDATIGNRRIPVTNGRCPDLDCYRKRVVTN